MTTTSRKALRAQLAIDLATLTQVQEVVPHLPRALKGKSPICSVESGGWQPSLNVEEMPTKVRVIIGFWVRRSADPGSTVPTAAQAEDMIDDLALALVNLLEGSYNSSFYRPLTLDYEVIDGTEYRIEFHYVEIDWW